MTAGLSLFGAPAAQRGLERALDRIARDQPWTQIRAGTVHRFGGWQLEAREVTARGDELHGILLWVPDIEETIFARNGRVGAAGDGSLQLELDTGILILSPALGPRQFRFDRLATVLPKSDEPGPWKSTDPFRALSLEALGAPGDRRARAVGGRDARVEPAPRHAGHGGAARSARRAAVPDARPLLARGRLGARHRR